MGSLVAVVFIAAAAAAGMYTGTKQTVISGEAMAARLLAQVAKKGVSKITCDDKIPVTPQGAVFTCKVWVSDGRTTRFKYVMNRTGALDASVLDATD